MPVDVITGQPGASKTLLLMEKLDDAIKANARAVAQGVPALVVDVEGVSVELPVRPIYCGGVNGLKPGLAIALKDPTKWNEIDKAGDPTCNCPALSYAHAHVIPDGSLILIDEAWQWLGHMHDASRMPTPKHALDLAIHRHRALDFILTTQSIKQIYPFVREIGGSHTHILRIWGSKLSRLYMWGEWNENVKSSTARENAVTEIWAQRKDLYSWYRSAAAHTIKLKVPKKIIMLPVLALALILAANFGWKRMFSHKAAEKVNAEIAVQSGGKNATSEQNSQVADAKSRKPSTAREWVTALTPVLPGIAYTAPIFSDSLNVTTHPRTLCVIVGSPSAGHCHCYTEQATPLDVPDGLCREITKRGYYDPFKPAVDPVVTPVQPLDKRAEAESVAIAASAKGDSALQGVPMPLGAGPSSQRLDAALPYPP